MNMTIVPRGRKLLALALLLTPLMTLLVCAGETSDLVVQPVMAQEADAPPADIPTVDAPPADAPPAAPAAGQAGAMAEAQQAAEAALAAGKAEAAAENAKTSEPVLPPAEEKKMNLLTLLISGGALMWPIGAMSLLVVAFSIERLLGLRLHKVLPPELISGLGDLAARKGGLDPRQAYKLCQQYPSAAANVIKNMLLKVGRPHSEVEHSVTEANEREAARLYANVRWLSLAAGVTPLLGLLGTVWGMIQAFFVTANLPTGANKAEHLAGGIYVALVTTLAGLSVAIPAAVLAHFFEGRIQSLFRELDETLLGLMPQLERFEGRMRMSKEQVEDILSIAAQPPAEAPPLKQPKPAAMPAPK